MNTVLKLIRRVYLDINPYWNLLLRFMLVRIIPIIFFLILFISNGTWPSGILAWIYLLTIPGWYYLFSLLPGLLLLPLLKWRPGRWVILLVYFIIDLLLLADLLVYYIFRFHINGMFINMFFFDFRGIGFSPLILIGLAVAVAVLIGLNWFYFHLADKFKMRSANKLLIVFIILFIAGQLIHIWGAGFHQTQITNFTPHLPVYYPTTSYKMTKRIRNSASWLVPAGAVSDDRAKANLKTFHVKGTLHYPQKPLHYISRPARRFNVLFFVLESWRRGEMDSVITPNIFQLAKHSRFYNNHISGGNVTVSGLYSLAYGLHPGYMKNMQADPQRYEPVLFDALVKNGYTLNVFTSSNLNRFTLRKMLFKQVADSNYHYLHSTAYVHNDSLLTEQLVSAIESHPSGQPALWFTFLTSSHHSYYYPQRHALFKPIATEGTFLLDKYALPGPFLNDYRNSLHWSDALFGKVYRALQRSGQLDSTIIVVTSDHGEAFNDNESGYWGHGSNFTRFQTSVPFILYLPDDPRGERINWRSGHVDVVPTIGNYLFSGLENPEQYSSGIDLLKGPEPRGLVSESYVNKAFIFGDTVYVDGLGIKSYDLNDIRKKNDKINYQKLRELMNKERAFIKK